MIKMQKIIKVGNSLAVTLDADFVKQTGLKAGDTMAASYKPEKKVVSLADSDEKLERNGAAEKEAYVAGKVTEEFRSWVEKSLEEDREAMEALKDL